MAPLPHRVQAWLEMNALDLRHQHIVRSMQIAAGAAVCVVHA
jgi:hypothetical protein